jgi:hypothetical protein
MALAAPGATLSVPQSQRRSVAMSATLSPPAVVDAVDSNVQLLRADAVPASIRAQPAAKASRVSTGRIGASVIVAAGTTGLVVASVVAAIALAVATPMVLARARYDERLYR